MKTSETQIALVGALFAARQTFPLIAKDHEGQVGNRKFKYAPLEKIRDATEPHLVLNGLMVTQGTEGHNIITRLDHTSGEWRESSMPVNAEHANMQSYGIEITYRRRYAYNLMLGIVTEEDTDGSGGAKRKGGTDHTADAKEKNDNGAPRALMYNQLDLEEQEAVDSAAEAVRAIWPDTVQALDYIDRKFPEDKEGSQELRGALAYRLTPSINSALKALSQKRRQPKE